MRPLIEIADASIETKPPSRDLVLDRLTTHGRGWCGLIRFGGIGDNLIAASVLKPLHEQGYRIEVMSGEPQHVVFENNPYVDRLIVKRREDIPGKSQDEWQDWFVKRSREYDKFVHLSHSCETIGALFTGQTAFWWPASMRRKLCGRSYLELVHDIAEVPYEFGRLYWPTEAEVVEVKEIKRKIGERCVGWCLAGSRIDKIWPATGLAIARVISELKLPVVVFGATQVEFEMAQRVLDHVERANGSRKDFHFARNADEKNPIWPIRRSLAMLQQCDVVVSPDTGPAWSVAFEEMGKVILLSHASPENITKHWKNTVTLHADQGRVPCHPCHRLHDSPDTCTPNKDKNGAACISDISVDAVLQAIVTKLSA